jgi:hypothetical protein
VTVAFALAIFFGLDGLVCFLLAERLVTAYQSHPDAWWSLPSRGVSWYRIVGVLLAALGGLFALMLTTRVAKAAGAPGDHCVVSIQEWRPSARDS